MFKPQKNTTTDFKKPSQENTEGLFTWFYKNGFIFNLAMSKRLLNRLGDEDLYVNAVQMADSDDSFELVFFEDDCDNTAKPLRRAKNGRVEFRFTDHDIEEMIFKHIKKKPQLHNPLRFHAMLLSSASSDLYSYKGLAALAVVSIDLNDSLRKGRRS